MNQTIQLLQTQEVKFVPAGWEDRLDELDACRVIADYRFTVFGTPEEVDEYDRFATPAGDWLLVIRGEYCYLDENGDRIETDDEGYVDEDEGSEVTGADNR